MSPVRKQFFTQWAAQFYAAAELTRRGYLVSLTLGNAPEADLIVRSPGDKLFEVDVKGLASTNPWLIQERPARPDLYFVLVHLPPLDDAPEFFIASSEEIMNAIAAYRERYVASGKEWPPSVSGLTWKMGLKYANRWQALPP